MRHFKALFLLLAAFSLAGCGGAAGLLEDGIDDLVDPGSEPAPEPAAFTSFVHRTTAANTLGSRSTIDHDLTNDNPNAVLIVTPNFNPGGGPGALHGHPIGVRYSATIGQWAVVNEDLALMDVDRTFNVSLASRETDGDTAFTVHTATIANTEGYVTYLTHPDLDGNPHATLLVTQNVTPRGEVGALNDQAIGVAYSVPHGQWVIYNESTDAMPEWAGFNVAIVDGAAGAPLATVQTHRTNAGNCILHFTDMVTTRHPDAILHVTHVFNPAGGVGGLAHEHTIGVGYRDGPGTWALVNHDVGIMGVGRDFFVAVAYE